MQQRYSGRVHSKNNKNKRAAAAGDVVDSSPCGVSSPISLAAAKDNGSTSNNNNAMLRRRRDNIHDTNITNNRHNSSSSSSSKNTNVNRNTRSRPPCSIVLPVLIAACCLISWALSSGYLQDSDGDDGLLGRWTNPVLRRRPRVIGPELGGFEFRGASRTGLVAGERPRIAIVTNAVAFPYTEKSRAMWSMFKEYFANKDCYARTHGYDLIVDSR